jgi:hypothetical protein
MAVEAKVTLAMVHRVVGIAQACLTVAKQTKALRADGKIEPPYDQAWQDNTQDKVDLLVTALAKQFGSNWTAHSPDTVIGSDAQNAYAEVRKLIPK